MLAFMSIDWESVFVPSLSIFEIILRGSLIYLLLFVIFRLLRRGAGSLGISDLLVVVLIADASQNALGSQYRSVTEGAVLVVTIVGWDYLLDLLAYRVPALRKLIRPPELLLIKNGEVYKRNLRKEMISEQELLGELREQGVAHVEDVKYCYMESDGRISVVKKGK